MSKKIFELPNAWSGLEKEQIILSVRMCPALLTFDCNTQYDCHDLVIIQEDDKFANVEDGLRNMYPNAILTKITLIKRYVPEEVTP